MQKGKILIFTSIILTVFPCLLMGFSFSEAKKLNTNDSSDGTSEEPQICSDNQGNVYACWRDDRRFEREYAITFAGGK